MKSVTMKKSLGISFIMAIGIQLSCHKADLNIPPSGLVDESKLANQKGVEGLLIGAYALLDGFTLDTYDDAFRFGGGTSNWIYGSICGSEAYKGGYDEGDQSDILSIEKFSATATNSKLAQKWTLTYAGVERANEVLRMMGKAKDIRDGDRKRISAEARFLRGFYHFEAIKVFHKIPYVDENVTYVNGNYFLPNDTLIWPAIENDFRYAMENLPEVMNAPGRVNKYAAEAYLAKTYLFQFGDRQKLLKAKTLLDELIQRGVNASGNKYELQNLYGNNFNLSFKNSGEAVFSAQISVNDGAQGWNGNIADILNYPVNGGPGGCCSFFQPSQYLVNHFKTDPLTGLPDLDHFNDVDVKNDNGIGSDKPFVPYDGPLDPRIDWTLGRRSIPYLDWGPHPGQLWIRNTTFGPYSPLKNTYYKEQQDKFTDKAFWTTGASANNINLLRFADILLWAAEVEVEVGSLDKARDYVNQIRIRAANQDGWVKNPDGSNAANYKTGIYSQSWTDPLFARKAVRYERMLELGMEGHRFFDLVRWGIADTEIYLYLKEEQKKRAHLVGAQFQKGKSEYFPIPQTQIDLSVGKDGIQKLKQNPGY